MKTNPAKTDSLTKGDLDKIADLLDKQFDTRLEPLATKEDLKDLKDYMHEGFETVMVGMDNIVEQLAEKKQVEKLEDWAKVVGDKVGLEPKL